MTGKRFWQSKWVMAFHRKIYKEDSYLKKAVQGDRAALEYLVKTYGDLAYTIALRVTRNRQDSEEIVQDSFMKAFSSLNTFRGSSKFSTWFYRIVYNTAISRKNKKSKSIVDSDYQGDSVNREGITNIGLNKLIQADKEKYLALALKKLSADDQIIFTMYYNTGLQLAEIGKILNMDKSALKMRLHRGRIALKKALKLMLGNERNDLL